MGLCRDAGPRVSHGPHSGQREGRKARRFPGLSCQPRPRKTQWHWYGEIGGQGGRTKRTTSPQWALLLPRQMKEGNHGPESSGRIWGSAWVWVRGGQEGLK